MTDRAQAPDLVGHGRPRVITERSDPAVQRIKDVIKHSRSAVRTAVIEDAEPLVQSIRADLEFIEVYGVETCPFPEPVRAACRERDIPVRLLGSAILNELFRAEKKPQVFGIARLPTPRTLEDLAGAPGDLVVLDGVKIVGNIGAIVRTGFALGAAGIVVVDSDLSTIADRRLIRASRGYVFSLTVVLASRSDAIAHLRHAGLRVVAFGMGGDLALGELRDLDERLVFLLGSEKTGVSRSLQGICGAAVSIPLNPAAESLNVSVCAGIALYERSHRNLATATSTPRPPGPDRRSRDDLAHAGWSRIGRPAGARGPVR